MKSWKKSSLILFTAVLLLVISGATAMAQNVDPNARSIRGTVYLDVNADGQCVNTGVDGEVPIEGIPVEFVSSDGAHVITLTTGDDGTYGLVAVGHGVWQVTAKPDASKYVVTSENPLFTLVDDDNKIQTGIDFCVAGGSGTIGNGVIVLPPVVLPESGAAATSNSNLIVGLVVLFGFGLLSLGAGLEVKRRAQK